MRQQLINTARAYTGDGISVTLTDDRKVSIGSWKEFQTRFITDEEINSRAAIAKGIAIICGSISGNLEVIDIDCKYDVTGKLWSDLLQSIPEQLMDKMVVAKTKSNGYHLYYRCSSVSPNSKLSRRPATDEEIASNPNLKVFVLIETRGEGGYVVAPPSDGYEWVSGTISDVVTISDSEKEQLWEICRSFNQYLDEPERIIDGNTGLSPIDDFNSRGDAIGLLERHGWKVVRKQGDKTYLRRPGKEDGTSGDWIESKRWFSVFSTSTQFEPNRAYNASALFCYLECGGNWKKATAELGTLGYGKDDRQLKKKHQLFTVVRRLKEKGLTDNQIVHKIVDIEGIGHEEANLELRDFYKNEELEKDRFWEINKNDKVIINKVKLIDYLTKNGFRVMPYDDAGNDVRLVSIDQNIVRETSIEKVKKVIYDYLKAMNTDEGNRVAAAILDKHTLFNTSFLEFMPKIPNHFLQDNKDTAYFPFKNGIVKVTKDGSELINYSDIKGFIWASHIVDHNISIIEQDKDKLISFDTYHSDVFPKFIDLISGQNDERFQAVCSHIGYCLHKYKDPKLPVAIILAEETDNDNQGGGTGKGIFTTAIGFLNREVIIDGKTFKPDKPFAFQRCNIDTNLIVIQDTRKNFDFEGLYPALTDGVTVEKKGQQEIFLKFERSPKFIITTNFTIPDQGNHAKRRQRVIPFSDYFSPKHTPYDEFGHQLFTEWSDDQWKTFFNYMFKCVQLYIRQGLVSIPVTDGIRLKGLKVNYGQEFRDYFEAVVVKESLTADWKPFAEMYREFLLTSDLSENEFTRKRFRSGIQNGCQSFGFTLETQNRGQNGGVSYKIYKRS